MSRARRSSVAVLVDATTPVGTELDAGELAATVRAVEALTAAGEPAHLVLVGPAPMAVTTTRPVVAVSDHGIAAGSALARGLAATRAARVAYVRVGARPDPSWLDRALDSLDRHHGAAVVAATPVDEARGEPLARPAGLSFTGHPLPAVAPHDGPGLVRTMVPGPAWVGRRVELEAVGSFDDELDQPFAGIDLAWRLWLAGREVLIDPTLTVAASEAAAGVTAPVGEAARRAEISALTMIYRNYDDASLAAALPAALELSRARLAARGVAGPADEGTAAADFAARLAALEVEREDVQAERRRPDAEILTLLGPALDPDDGDEGFLAAHAATVAAASDLARFTGRRRVVVATADAITTRMAGPAIRAWRLASELALDHEVRLVSITVGRAERPLVLGRGRALRGGQ